MDNDISLIVNTLEAHKALDIRSFEGTHSFLPENIVIASGTSSRHVAALAGYVEKTMKKQGTLSRIDGMQQANWVVLDSPSVCVHIFRPEVRAYYDLESLYACEDHSSSPRAAV